MKFRSFTLVLFCGQLLLILNQRSKMHFSELIKFNRKFLPLAHGLKLGRRSCNFYPWGNE